MTVANEYTVLRLLGIGEDDVYAIPPYQREYKWGKQERDEFFDDIQDNDAGYFLGSIICVSRKEEALKQHWELVDGQQRMISLSLILAAIYSKLDEFSKENLLTKAQENKLCNLKQQLVLESNEDKIRVVPSIQNHNKEDYEAVLSKVLSNNDNKTKAAGNRRIFQSYHHFQDKISKFLDQSDNKVEATFEFLEKVSKARVVMIDGESRQGAYILFRSLNDRGKPLTATELIKSILFASLEKSIGNVDSHFVSDWDQLLDLLSDDDMVQERFFRQYYNAFQKNMIKGYPVANRSNLIKIYEKIIGDDPKGFFDKIIAAARNYSFILGRYDKEESAKLKKLLLDLEHIEGTPSYLLLLYLLEGRNQLGLKDKDSDLCEIVQYLTLFFVRRNLTDRPATRDLDRLFMHIVDQIDRSTSDDAMAIIKRELLSRSSDDDTFKRYLAGPVYSQNSRAVRFILCAIEAESWPEKEPIYDLWEKANGKYVRTIEHIFPQGDKIPPSWKKMIANGDEATAIDLKAKYADCLGNLTLTGYNPELGNMSFEEKRDRKDEEGRFIGYRNQLNLNKSIKDLNKWTVEDIQNRTRQLVDKTLELFALEDKNKPIEAQ